MRKRIEAVSPVVATILMVAMTVVLTALLYIMVLGMIGGDIGTGSRLGSITLTHVDNSTFNGEFGKFEPQTKPLDLKVIVEYGTNQSVFTFASNGDGDLTFASGTKFCDISYNDQADDNWISRGDYLIVTNLPSGGTFDVIILDASSGAKITSQIIDLPG